VLIIWRERTKCQGPLQTLGLDDRKMISIVQGNRYNEVGR
jgi:hypothetical protein